VLAEEAAEMGLVNRVLPPAELMDFVTGYARDLAATVSPGSLRATRHQIYRDLHRPAVAAVADAQALLERMTAEPDFAEGVKAFREKRPARWQQPG
jgi:enoyl-CoA hydratase/carnithine racemase